MAGNAADETLLDIPRPSGTDDIFEKSGEEGFVLDAVVPAVVAGFRSTLSLKAPIEATEGEE